MVMALAAVLLPISRHCTQSDAPSILAAAANASSVVGSAVVADVATSGKRHSCNVPSRLTVAQRRDESMHTPSTDSFWKTLPASSTASPLRRHSLTSPSIAPAANMMSVSCCSNPRHRSGDRLCSSCTHFQSSKFHILRVMSRDVETAYCRTQARPVTGPACPAVLCLGNDDDVCHSMMILSSPPVMSLSVPAEATHRTLELCPIIDRS
mmetsp:Transcript_71660/g.168771  ORF Transcript_71660/g.168771 Transcript_71660/m.168771 type:complete len:209 (-) Transcript_71660:582-1208(-)